MYFAWEKSSRAPRRYGRFVCCILRLAAVLAVAEPAHAQGTASLVAAVGDSLPAVRLDSLLDLETVVRRALAVSPDVTGAEQGVRTAESGRRVANGELLPDLTANASLLRSNVTSVPDNGTLPPDAFAAGLAASVDVFTGGRRSADRARANADLGAAQAGNVAQRFAVTFTAQAAFFEALRANDLVDVARASVAQARQTLRYAEDRVRAGTTTRSDELRAQLELTTSQQQLVAALDTLQTAGWDLGRLVGADGPVGSRRPASLEPRQLALSDSEVVRLAIDASPEVQTALAQQRADEAALKSARTQYVPDVRLSGGYNWADQSTLIYATRPGWQLTLGTSFPLFNGFQREDNVIRADAAAQVARVTSLDVVRQARADAERLLSRLRFAEQSIALANQGVASASEDLRVQTERYRAGIATELDELTSELAYTQAQIALVGDRYSYQLTLAQLEALVGRVL
ncbi:MAG TPA: TolC family protein [Gemmatimonadales bacterium]|jgi:outer membrane protein TolC|nr:TolC family protein [Gemmatimonadales bacterium]